MKTHDHHCPGFKYMRGNCRFTEGDGPSRIRYCTTHQELCNVCNIEDPHMKDEQCGKCKRTEEHAERERREEEERRRAEAAAAAENPKPLTAPKSKPRMKKQKVEKYVSAKNLNRMRDNARAEERANRNGGGPNNQDGQNGGVN